MSLFVIFGLIGIVVAGLVFGGNALIVAIGAFVVGGLGPDVGLGIVVQVSIQARISVLSSRTERCAPNAPIQITGTSRPS